MSKLCIFRALGILFLFPLIGSSVLAQNVKSARDLTIQQMLNNMAEAFRHKIGWRERKQPLSLKALSDI